MTASEAVLVIFGLGKDQKPRAARFALSDEAVALRAAHAMELGVGRAETVEAISLAKSLPEGKPFATGKSLLPLTKTDTYERLIKTIKPLEPKLIGKAPEKPAAIVGTATSSSNPASYNPWSEIRIGSVVLHRDPEPGPERSWWEAVVTQVSKDGRVLTMRWKSFPTPKPLTAKRTSVALLCKIS